MDDVSKTRPTTSRRYSVQLVTFGAFERWYEVAAAQKEGSANAIAWLWSKHDPGSRVRVYDLRTERVTMTPEAIASLNEEVSMV